MAPDPSDWTAPAPLRALLWWPAVAFALFLVSPESAVGAIAAAGLLLVGAGALTGAAGRRWRRARQATAEPSATEMGPVTQVA